MKLTHTICCSLLVICAVISAHASLSWSWEYTEPNVFAGPTDSLELMIEILNDISSTEDLNIAGQVVAVDPAWSSYYTLDAESVATVLSPGQSTNLLYGILNPIGVVPVGTEFDFHTSLFTALPDGEFRDPVQDLHVTVVPEPTSLILIVLGVFVLHSRHCRTKKWSLP